MSEAIAKRAAQRYANHQEVFPQGRSKVAGEVVFKKDQGPLQRELPRTPYKFSATALRPMTKSLWHLSIALGHLVAASNTFDRIKASTISPDGRLGGRGFIQNIRDMRTGLAQARELVSANQDTLHDDITARHWAPAKKRMSAKDRRQVEKILGEAEEIMDDPEGAALEEEVEELGDAATDETDETEEDDNLTPDDPDDIALKGDVGENELPETAPEIRMGNLKLAGHQLWAWEGETKVIDPSPYNLPGPRMTEPGAGTGNGPHGTYNDMEKPDHQKDDRDLAWTWTTQDPWDVSK